MYFIIVILIWILSLISNILAFNQIKKCENCRWFIKGIKNPQNNNLDSYNDLCTLFTINSNNKPIYSKAIYCRDNEFLCGKNGWFYENKLTTSNNKYVNLFSDKEIKEIEFNSKEKMINDNKDFFSNFNSDEINQIDKDFLEIKNKYNNEDKNYLNYINTITKNNKKNKIYKNEKDIYKIFKKK